MHRFAIRIISRKATTRKLFADLIGRRRDRVGRAADGQWASVAVEHLRVRGQGAQRTARAKLGRRRICRMHEQGAKLWWYIENSYFLIIQITYRAGSYILNFLQLAQSGTGDSIVQPTGLWNIRLLFIIFSFIYFIIICFIIIDFIIIYSLYSYVSYKWSHSGNIIFACRDSTQQQQPNEPISFGNSESYFTIADGWHAIHSGTIGNLNKNEFMKNK